MRILARLLVPFNFALDFNEPITFTVDEEIIILVGDKCEGVSVNSYFDKDYCKLQGSKKGREFYRVRDPKSQKDVGIRTFIINKESEYYLEGTIDLLKSTLFDIYFDFPDKEFLNDDESKRTILKKAYHIIDFFINSYRAVTSEADIHNPSTLDLPVIELAYSKKNWKKEKDILEGEYYFLSRTYNWLNQNVTGYTKNKLNKETLQKFNDYLNSNEPIPYHLQLLADSREQAIIRKNYNLSVVLSSTATEFYLKERLIRECNSRKIAKLIVGKKKNKIEKNTIEAILEGSLRDEIIGDICTFVTGENIKESLQYQNWYRDAYDIRNSIIHKGLIINDEEISKKAFKAVIVFLNHVNNLLISSRTK